MQIQGLKKCLASLLSVAMLAGMASATVSAEETYTPNRSIAITNVSESAPKLKFSVMPFNLGDEGGPYHMFGKMKIEGFEAIDATKDASVSIVMKYENYDENGELQAPEKQTEVKWTANTNGWVDMTQADGKHIEIDTFESDLTIEFSMLNAKGTFTFADWIIADKTNAIVYSLANDPTLSGVTNLAGTVGDPCLWMPSVNKEITTVKVTSKEYAYTPNRVLSVNIPATYPAEGEESTPTTNPESNAYFIFDFSNQDVFPEEKGPYTVQGMFKVDNFAVNTFADHAWISANACFAVQDAGIRPLRGNTDGWIPLVKLDGTPYTFTKTSAWQNLILSWGVTGNMYLADIVITDKDGNVAYSFEKDATLPEGDIAWRTEYAGGALKAWAYFTGLGGYKYAIAETPVEHTAADYALHSFEETYTPYVEPTQPTNPTKPTDPSSPETGSGAPIAALVMAVSAVAASAVFVGKKRQAR